MRHFIAFFLSILACSPTVAQGKPTRSECIIGFRLDWSQVPIDRRDIANAIAETNRTERIETLAGLAFQASHSELYLMFRSGCEAKAQLASEQIDRWRRKGLNLPDFEQIQDPIIPSTETIDIQGPHWRDGLPDGIPPAEFHAEPEIQPI